MSQSNLAEAAQSLLPAGETVVGAGAFALKDNFKAIEAGGIISTALPGSGNPALEGVEAGASIEASRQANAAAHGVSERMLVAITDTTVYVLSLPALGNTPKEVLMTFSREHAQIKIKRFGLNHDLNLNEGDQELKLQVSATPFTESAKETKALLASLQS